jgi:hypothetical protein
MKMPNQECKVWRALKPARTLSRWFCFLALPFALCLPATAQYSIDWYKISGGGGTGTGGVYSVSGTVGQHDAGGPMTGGSYSLTGGFWALYAVQIPGAPMLYIARTGPATATVWWLPGSGSYTLQTNTSLSATAGWADFGGTITSSGGTNSVTLSPPAGTLFFRLKQ